jgi:hypothetical protein
MSLKSIRPLAPSSPAAPLPSTMGCWQRPRNLYAARHIWIPLRLEPVRCRECARGSAVEAADEDLFAAFQVGESIRRARTLSRVVVVVCFPESRVAASAAMGLTSSRAITKPSRRPFVCMVFPNLAGGPRCPLLLIMAHPLPGVDHDPAISEPRPGGVGGPLQGTKPPSS